MGTHNVGCTHCFPFCCSSTLGFLLVLSPLETPSPLGRLRLFASCWPVAILPPSHLSSPPMTFSPMTRWRRVCATSRLLWVCQRPGWRASRRGGWSKGESVSTRTLQRRNLLCLLNLESPSPQPLRWRSLKLQKATVSTLKRLHQGYRV